jgi:hypothetical protein
MLVGIKFPESFESRTALNDIPDSPELYDQNFTRHIVWR